MKLFLVAALLSLTTPSFTPSLAVTGGGPECVARAIGDVETFLVLHYENAPTYTTPVVLLPSGEASVAYDWGPVAVQWYGKPSWSNRFKLVGGCGRIPPKNVSRDPGDIPPLEACYFRLDEPMELYARAYYLHADPEDPYKRFTYKSPTTMMDLGLVELDMAFPVYVEWYYRQCASLVSFPPGDWTLAKTCGTMPGGVL